MEDQFAIYLRKVCNHKLLTQEQEHSLFRRHRAGDREATNKLVLANMRLIVNVSKKWFGSKLDKQDVVSEAVLGFYDALETFDPELGNRLSTHATQKIMTAVSKAVSVQGYAHKQLTDDLSSEEEADNDY